MTPSRRGNWRRGSRNACATMPTWRRPNWRWRRAPSPCSMPMPTCRADLPGGCPNACAMPLRAMGCAIRTCCRSHPPAPSRWPLPTMRPMASSPPSRGPITARSGCRTTATAASRWRIMPGGFTVTWGPTWPSCRMPSSPRCRCRRWTICGCWKRCSRISTPASARPSTCRRIIRTKPSATCTWRPGRPA
ncbi:hypothetical protein D9M72_464620 [compost metagenome]